MNHPSLAFGELRLGKPSEWRHAKDVSPKRPWPRRRTGFEPRPKPKPESRESDQKSIVAFQRMNRGV